ncbi:MAG TPA: lytic transglycosylase domain-containing protein, partial [Burkholderiaceae bacterium]
GRAGSLEGGLKYYVGAANFADDGGYAAKVLAEQTNLRRVADGKWVSVYVTLPATTNPTPIEVKGVEAPRAGDTDKVAWVRSGR